MNIQNIELEVIYKNLKELCNVLDLEYKDSTNSRKAIVKNIEQYLKLERCKNSYIVKEIYNTLVLKKDNRGKAKSSRSNNSVYVKHIDVLVKGTLFNMLQDKNTIYTSTTAILQSINLTDDTFKEELSTIQKDNYNTVKLKLLSTLNNMLDSSLKRLERQSYIKLKESYVIRESDTTRLATREEAVNINIIREQILKELNIKAVQLLLNKNIRYKFYNKLKSRVTEQIDTLEALQSLYRGFKIQSNTKLLSTTEKADIQANRQQLINLINKRVFNI